MEINCLRCLARVEEEDQGGKGKTGESYVIVSIVRRLESLVLLNVLVFLLFKFTILQLSYV